jgi:hypothetical protein
LEGVDGGGSCGSGMGMGRLGFSVAEVGGGGKERTVDVKPGTRSTTSFCMLWVFYEPMSVSGTSRVRGLTCTLIQLGGGESAMM